ncbi:hypothetical protein N7456_002346 [Penicillium angulare]|uniref:Uncharacterized protein n=1 Tax=Penicillium angulare TaxID=116970 RepID=A0A9W9G9A0_9EURO|nr:hypothetical protein N7456_002346 [Penicillium angulare]
MELGVTCSVGLFALASASEHSGACLEPLVQCGANGYPLGFGAKYCDKFLENKSDFSDRGQKWEEDVGQCLQDALVPFVNGSKQPDCQDLKEYAIGTHARCYVGTGFCSLGLWTN